MDILYLSILCLIFIIISIIQALRIMLLRRHVQRIEMLNYFYKQVNLQMYMKLDFFKLNPHTCFEATWLLIKRDFKKQDFELLSEALDYEEARNANH